ncbi:MAG: hypothetical protein ACREA9_11435 [Pyrinomonadaceae bacterium]
MAKARRPLAIRDVGELLKRSPRTGEAILVGGQALNVWAVHFGLAAETAALSDDIDFFGSRAQAIAAGLDWGAKVATPSLDDQTPNSAVVMVEVDDEERGIDFLNSIAGVESRELSRWASTVSGGTYGFKVMHPLHVLQSQLENVYGVLDRRNERAGEYYAGRVALAIQVTAHAVTEILDAASKREALKAAERIAAMAVKRPALEAWHRDHLDLLGAIPEHKAWSPQFLNKRLPQVTARVEAMRQKYVSRLTRGGSGK